MKIGCSTILYGGHPVETALDRIAAAGYEAIELCCIGGMAPHFDPEDKGALPALKDKIAASGLSIESIGASGRLGGGIEGFTRVLEAAAALGAPAVTTGSGGKSDDEESFAENVKTFQALGQRAKGLGVAISVKPHVRSAVYSTPTALRFMKEMDPAAVGINFDASHLWRSDETPEDSLEQLKSHVTTARFRDTKSREIPIGGVEFQVPGGGAMNLPTILKGIAALERTDTVTLEIVGTKEWEVPQIDEVIQKSIAYAKKVLA